MPDHKSFKSMLFSNKIKFTFIRCKDRFTGRKCLINIIINNSKAI